MYVIGPVEPVRLVRPWLDQYSGKSKKNSVKVAYVRIQLLLYYKIYSNYKSPALSEILTSYIVLSIVYRIAGNIGGELNLTVWRSRPTPPNLKNPKFCSSTISPRLRNHQICVTEYCCCIVREECLC
jgi:hypothetical protein